MGKRIFPKLAYVNILMAVPIPVKRNIAQSTREKREGCWVQYTEKAPPEKGGTSEWKGKDQSE